MKLCHIFFILLTFGLLCPFIGRGQVLPQSNSMPVVGIWQGALKVQGMELRIVFKISQKPDGTLAATMDSPDQGAKDIPVDSVIVSDRSVRLPMAGIRGEYAGQLLQGDSAIGGKWTQGGMTFSLPLKRTSQPVELKRPQEPKRPYPYKEEEVSYVNTLQGDTLAGTLTYPTNGGPFPVALLITGSGKQNRDEELLGHKPFLVLADYLTRRGIAVLRVDDRGAGKSTGDFIKATTRDFATDVRAGIEFLKTRKEIDPTKIGLIGHSEGGIIAPMVASESQDVAFVVMMAGTGVTGEEVLYKQDSLISKANGMPDSVIAKDLKLAHRMYTVVTGEEDTTVAKSSLQDLLTSARNELPDSEKVTLSDAAIVIQIRSMLSPWFRQFLTYDPRPALRKVKYPVLAINGEKDLQVPPKQNLPEIKKALREGGNTHFEVKELPSLNHLFQTAQTGSPLEYSKIEETISPLALETIGNWILETVKKN